MSASLAVAPGVPTDAGLTEPPSRKRRLLAALCVGLFGAGWTWWWSRHEPGSAASDFDIVWIAARALLEGKDPYAAVLEAGWKWPFYYPLPAALVGVPFAAFSRVVARAIFVGISSASLAFVMARRGWWGLLVLLSPPFLHGFFHAQWTPLLVAAMLLPPIGGLLVVKPSVGLAYFAARPSWIAAAGGAVLLALSFLALPGWPGLWLAAVQEAPHIVPPVIRPGGVILLLALLRWRLPEGRLIAGLACVPHVTFLYETLPLFTIPKSFREMGALVVLAHLATYLIARLVPASASDLLNLSARWPYLLVFIYLPALMLVLLRPRVLEAPLRHDPGP